MEIGSECQPDLAFFFDFVAVVSSLLVEMTGLEPVTSSLQSWRSPS